MSQEPHEKDVKRFTSLVEEFSVLLQYSGKITGMQAYYCLYSFIEISKYFFNEVQAGRVELSVKTIAQYQAIQKTVDQALFFNELTQETISYIQSLEISHENFELLTKFIQYTIRGLDKLTLNASNLNLLDKVIIAAKVTCHDMVAAMRLNKEAEKEVTDCFDSRHLQARSAKSHFFQTARQQLLRSPFRNIGFLEQCLKTKLSATDRYDIGSKVYLLYESLIKRNKQEAAKDLIENDTLGYLLAFFLKSRYRDPQALAELDIIRRESNCTRFQAYKASLLEEKAKQYFSFFDLGENKSVSVDVELKGEVHDTFEITELSKDSFETNDDSSLSEKERRQLEDYLDHLVMVSGRQASNCSPLLHRLETLEPMNEQLWRVHTGQPKQPLRQSPQIEKLLPNRSLTPDELTEPGLN